VYDLEIVRLQNLIAPRIWPAAKPAEASQSIVSRLGKLCNPDLLAEPSPATRISKEVHFYRQFLVPVTAR
jgi:hypothetical protein